MKARVYVPGLLLLIIGFLCQDARSEEQIQLTKIRSLAIASNGSTDYRIMIGPEAATTEEFAAQELQGYLMQISGVFLPMAQRNTPVVGKLIFVGSSAVNKLGLEVDESFLGPDGFVIKTVGDKIILAGGSPRGTLYSVYAFLEMLGCRWLAPGVIGEVIPQMPTVIIPPIDHSERPSMKYRGFMNFLPVDREGVQWIDWMSKNRMNYLMIRLPNYASLKTVLGGELKRRGIDIGVRFDSSTLDAEDKLAGRSTSGSIRIAADQIMEFISNNPEVGIIEICAEASEISGGQYVRSMIEIAEEIRGQYPDKLILLMVRDGTIPDVGYSMLDRSQAVKGLRSSQNPGVLGGVHPLGTPAPPVSGHQYPASRRCYRHSLGDDNCEINSRIRSYLESQLRIWNRGHVYEYYMGSYDQYSLPFPILHTIASDIRYFDKLEGLEGVISQCELGNWGAYGLNYYVFARVAWDADGEMGSIVDDYCEKYYGTASGPMKRYFARLEDSMSAMEHFRYVAPPELILKLLDERSLAALEMEIQKAKSLANDAMIFDRIRKAQLSLDHANFLWHMLNDYFQALQFQEAGENEQAMDHFQKAVQMGEKLVAFLFQNVDEGVFIIPESYIFDYLGLLITDARGRRRLLEAE